MFLECTFVTLFKNPAKDIPGLLLQERNTPATFLPRCISISYALNIEKETFIENHNIGMGYNDLTMHHLYEFQITRYM